MIAKYREGVVPAARDATTLDEAGQRVVEAYARGMDACDLRAGADGPMGGPKPFAKTDRSRFLQELDAALVRLGRR